MEGTPGGGVTSTMLYRVVRVVKRVVAIVGIVARCSAYCMVIGEL